VGLVVCNLGNKHSTNESQVSRRNAKEKDENG